MTVPVIAGGVDVARHQAAADKIEPGKWTVTDEAAPGLASKLDASVDAKNPLGSYVKIARSDGRVVHEIDYVDGAGTVRTNDDIERIIKAVLGGMTNDDIERIIQALLGGKT